MGRQSASPNRNLTSVFTVLALALGLLVAPGRGAIGSENELTAETEQEASDLAKSTGEPVVVLGDMAKDTLVTAKSDGTFAAELSSGPVRELDPTSPTGWSPIDLTLEPGPDGLEPAVADADITFSDGGAGTLASISRDGLTFALQTGQDLPAPTITGDIATYLDVLPGVDLVLQVRPAGFEQSYLLHAPPKEPLVFDLSLSLQGVTATVDDRGQLVLTDGDGNQVAQASPAVMFGAAVDPNTDEPVDQAPVSTAIVSTKDGPVLQVSPDPAFLSRPGLTYPVTVDPAPDFSVAIDTYVKSTAPSTSYGTDGVLKSGTPDGTEADRTLVSFSGTTVLEDTHVLSATLKLWETHSYSCTPRRWTSTKPPPPSPPPPPGTPNPPGAPCTPRPPWRPGSLAPVPTPGST